MKDNQKKYLDRVVDLMVRDTVIGYDDERVRTPFLSSSLSFRLFPSSLSSISPSPPYLLLPSSYPLFSKYCRNTYGLNDDEIEYVWEEYVQIIKDKIRNER